MSLGRVGRREEQVQILPFPLPHLGLKILPTVGGGVVKNHHRRLGDPFAEPKCLLGLLQNLLFFLVQIYHLIVEVQGEAPVVRGIIGKVGALVVLVGHPLVVLVREAFGERRSFPSKADVLVTAPLPCLSSSYQDFAPPGLPPTAIAGTPARAGIKV